MPAPPPAARPRTLLQLADCRVLALDHRCAPRADRIRENLARERLPESTGPRRRRRQTVASVGRLGAGGRRHGARSLVGRPAVRPDPARCAVQRVGIVRRHPDVPGIAAVATSQHWRQQQRLLLQALWPLLRPGGTLLYVTCSIFPEEGETVIAAFCSHQADCVRQSISTPGPTASRRCRNLLPTSTGQREHDGFFYALLSKQTVNRRSFVAALGVAVLVDLGEPGQRRHRSHQCATGYHRRARCRSRCRSQRGGHSERHRRARPAPGVRPAPAVRPTPGAAIRCCCRRTSSCR